MQIPSQNKLNRTIPTIPIEWATWGKWPDHFKIDMPHRHQFSELLFISKGGGIHEIDFEDYPIGDSSIHYIPASKVHFLKRAKHSDGFTIAYDDNYISKNKIHLFKNPFSENPFILNLKKQEFEAIIQITNIIKTQIQQDKSYYKEKCFLISLELLFHSIADKKHNISSNEVTNLSAFSASFFKLIQENIHKTRNVDWYAQQLKVSSKYLGNKIKSELDQAPKTLLKTCFLKALKHILLATEHPIKQIAENHNIALSTLYKFFKKEVGYTMSEYRSFKKK